MFIPVWRDESYDCKSDIWSMGCVLYEMCTLNPPFRAKDMDTLFKKVQRGAVEKIPKVYSNDLWLLISSLLRVSPRERPTSEMILANSAVLRHARGEVLRAEMAGQAKHEDRPQLLQTIKLPKNLHLLKDKLPKAKYHPDSELWDADIDVAPQSALHRGEKKYALLHGGHGSQRKANGSRVST